MAHANLGHHAFPNPVRQALFVPFRFGSAGGNGLFARYQSWRDRVRTRNQLMQMSEHQLKDIGLSRYDAEKEWSKPFWQD